MAEKTDNLIVVISAVNLVEGGPFSILKEALESFIKHFSNQFKLVILINNKKLVEQFSNNSVKIIEYAYPKKFWLLRAWFEYVHCKRISSKINADIWIALHDMTPNVCTKKQVVYCHNPAPFYKLKFREAILEKTLVFFNLFYDFFYRKNIHKNKYVIVQQQWLRKEFATRYNINDKDIIVAHPEVHPPPPITNSIDKSRKFSFLYPSFPRVFKNFEVLLRAAEDLFIKRSDFEVLITVKGTENAYAKWLSKNFSHLACARFIGLQKRENMWKLYNESDCLVFPSKLETWGLPVTEMKFYDKPLLVARERYAYETVGEYKKCCFFESSDYKQLSSLMNNLIDNTLIFDKPGTVAIDQPFATNWKELYNLILN